LYVAHVHHSCWLRWLIQVPQDLHFCGCHCEHCKLLFNLFFGCYQCSTSCFPIYEFLIKPSLALLFNFLLLFYSLWSLCSLIYLNVCSRITNRSFSNAFHLLSSLLLGHMIISSLTTSVCGVFKTSLNTVFAFPTASTATTLRSWINLFHLISWSCCALL
jgi:hypothetical protein